MKINQRLSVFVVVLGAANSHAMTRYVDATSISPKPPYTNWTTAAVSIQDAVDVAGPGDGVLVANGVYATGGRVVHGTLTNRLAVTKPLTVQSVNGPAVTAIEGYPIMGDSAVRCVYMTNGATLSGFTVTRGATQAYVGFGSETQGGGIWCESTRAIISNCVISANTAQYYGGGTRSGSFYNCIFAGNYAPDGGGGTLDAILENCVLRTNTAYTWGGGAYYSTLNNCSLYGNSASLGGGAASCTLSNCVLFWNSAGAGGGAWAGTMFNCSVSDNTAGTGGGVQSSVVYNCALARNRASAGGGEDSCLLANCTLTCNFASTTGGGANGGTMNNCIVYFNNAPRGSNYAGSTLNYSCTAPLPTAGSNNITLEPQLADSTHLSVESPCRGLGDPFFVTGVDIDGDSWASPPSIGCDEYHFGGAVGPLSVTFEASYTNVPVRFPVGFLARILGHAGASQWEFGDGTMVSNQPYTSHAWREPGSYKVVLRVYNDTYPAGLAASVVVSVLDHPIQYVALTSTNPVVPYLTWATAATNIQDAVDVAYINGTILVSNGVYKSGGRVASGSLTNRVAITRPLILQSVNGPGLTVIEGNQVPGTTNGYSAVRCLYITNGAMVVGFTLTNGATWASVGLDGEGGGVLLESPSATLSNCVIINNCAYLAGGGAHRGTLYNCLVTGNRAMAPIIVGGPSSEGGGVSRAILNACVVVGNFSFTSGGGVAESALNDCMVVSNSASFGGGSYMGVLRNCEIIGNSASNSRYSAGGGSYGSTLTNCITYYNSAPTNDNYYIGYFGGPINHCCTAPLAPGAGNIIGPPRFVNLTAGNLRLGADSPCINSGANLGSALAWDLDGNPRIVSGTVDIGAYEFQGTGSVISYAWLQRYGFPTDGSADYSDPDGDGADNYLEWFSGSDPTNALSAPPVITVQPVSQHVLPGTDVTLGLKAIGTTPLSYQWRYNETNDLPGATNTVLIISNVQPASLGSYSVQVTNVYGAILSSDAVLTLDQAPLADAGATPSAVISPNGVDARLILNGTRSSDPDSDPLRYLWLATFNSQPVALLASGAVAVVQLPIGMHWLMLVVSDGLLYSTNAFGVEVITPRQAIERLAVAVKAAVSPAQPLLAGLAAAQDSLDRSNCTSAHNQLKAFQNKVRAQVTPSDPALAANFIHSAQDILEALSVCEPSHGSYSPAQFTSVIRRPNGRVHLEFYGEHASHYILEASTNLVNWQMIGLASEQEAGVFSAEDPNAPTFPNRFYRLVSP
jgi:hypothetical protein